MPDDAGVYKINNHLALVLTTDFFPPVVDNPYDYGRIAVANSLSDIYAMGGKPVAGLNIVGFPEKESPDILKDILKGGSDVAYKAGVPIIGGHSIKNPEPIYGLAVTGIINPNKIISKQGAKPGDVIVLTKPLGTGILTTALKKNIITEEQIGECVETMAMLNKAASEVMVKVGVNGATDITGFGLLGHLLEMAKFSDVTISIDANAVPLLDMVIDLAKQNVYPGGTKSNYEYVRNSTYYDPQITFETAIAFCDAQTSGGLAISLPRRKAKRLLNMIKEKHPKAALIGEVMERSEWLLKVKKG